MPTTTPKATTTPGPAGDLPEPTPLVGTNPAATHEGLLAHIESEFRALLSTVPNNTTPPPDETLLGDVLASIEALAREKWAL